MTLALIIEASMESYFQFWLQINYSLPDIFTDIGKIEELVTRRTLSIISSFITITFSIIKIRFKKFCKAKFFLKNLNWNSLQWQWQKRSTGCQEHRHPGAKGVDGSHIQGSHLLHLHDRSQRRKVLSHENSNLLLHDGRYHVHLQYYLQREKKLLFYQVLGWWVLIFDF